MSDFTFVGQVADFSAIPPKTKRAILIGAASFISIKDVGLENYTPIEPRFSISPFKRLYVRNPAKVYCILQDDILVTAPKNMQFAFANDAYLKWGYGTKGKCIFFGGISYPDKTYLQVFVFQDGALESTEERELDGTETSFYSETIAGLVDEFKSKYHDAKFYYTHPLGDLSDAFIDIEFVSPSIIFKKLSYRKLDFTANTSNVNSFLPFAIVGISSVVLAGFLWKGWTNFNGAVEAYHLAMSDPIVRQDGGIGGSYVDTMQQQRFFMLTPRYQGELANKTRHLVNAVIRISNARIISLKTQSPTNETADKVSDVQIVLTVPLSNRSALEQGKEILDVITSYSGISLHMAQQGQGWKDNEKDRQFTFEGMLDPLEITIQKQAIPIKVNN